MNITICAWGSLIWDPRTLRIGSPFTPTGPVLPVEFSRISGRDPGPLRLTLVIDEDNGVPCRTHIATSGCSNLSEAIEDLRIREGMLSCQDVGVVLQAGNAPLSRAELRHPRSVALLGRWLAGNSFDAVIWTALPSNFAARSEFGAAFTVPEALRHLGTLPQDSLEASLAYFRKAPAEIETPLRRAVRIHWPAEGEQNV